MGVIGDMNKFQQYQMGEAMMAAAEKPVRRRSGRRHGSGHGFRDGQPHGPGDGRHGESRAGGTAPLGNLARGDRRQVARSGAVEKIAQGIARGKLTRETQVWCAGMDAWKPAGEVPQLAQLFASSPPPPPPA